MILDAITPKQPRLLVADLDGTLLHDAEVFEDRFITQRSIDTINRAHDAGMQFAIATARPVSTGLQFAEKLPVDAVIYLNGALTKLHTDHSVLHYVKRIHQNRLNISLKKFRKSFLI